jgi:hypothetical protein
VAGVCLTSYFGHDGVLYSVAAICFEMMNCSDHGAVLYSVAAICFEMTNCLVLYGVLYSPAALDE